MKNTSLLLILFYFMSFQMAFAQPKKLQINEDNRHLIYEDGTPFFYLGDTAWDLFFRLDSSEANLYLTNRAEKGFTVIQAVAVAIESLKIPNANGDFSLIDKKPEKPNEAYFKHVDFIVNRAEELGLYMAITPAWGNHWNPTSKDAIFTPENAYWFGKYLGKRYIDRPVIWVLGGDSKISSETDRKIINSMAEGLKEGDKGNHLITYHPVGPGFSSDYFHDADWLDFNMYQSSHGAYDIDNGLFAEHDYHLDPVKPTMDGEPRYETLPVAFYFKGFGNWQRFDDYDCRQAAYWSLLAGALGHTYGNNCVWQMWEPGQVPNMFTAQTPWYEALDHPGAFQMGYVRKLFESRPFQELEPAQQIVVDGPVSGGAKIRAALAENGSFAIIYTPRGEKFSIDKSVINGSRIKEIWYDPRYGTANEFITSGTKGIQTYTPPTSGRGNDWILVLENADLNFPLLGTK